MYPVASWTKGETFDSVRLWVHPRMPPEDNNEAWKMAQERDDGS